MSRYFFLIFSLLFLSVRSQKVDPSKFIKLALSVSKAAYIPSRYIKRRNGLILQETQEGQYKPACNVGNWDAEIEDAYDTEVYLFTNKIEKLAVFGFRGTEPTNLNDWAKNFNIKLTSAYIRGKYFKLHDGFKGRYVSIEKWFKIKCKEIPKHYTIILTGHSLGGALATISAAFASGLEIDRTPDAVITFGSPRVGDTDFEKYYRRYVGCDRTIRIAEIDDIVTSVPPVSEYGYREVCCAMEVGNGVESGLLNAVKNHNVYTGYGKGLERKYGTYMPGVNVGCDYFVRFQ